VTRAYTVGLTGGVATGKTYVAGLFEALGVPLLDADQVAREVVAPPSPVLERIAAEFGPDYLLADGSLDRRRMRERIFADDEARRRLEAITHPAIRPRIAGWRAAQTTPYCILSNAILLESGMDAQVDRVLVIDAADGTRMARLVRRDALPPDLAQRMIAAQLARVARLARADDVIDNDHEHADLRPSIRRLHQLYSALASG
jgi:dephospho-CoA kinase